MEKSGGDYYESDVLMARFYPNRTYALLGSKGYSFGTWKGDLEKETVELFPKQSNELSAANALDAAHLSADSLFLLCYNEHQEPTNRAFAMGAIPEFSKNDPFSLKLNQWRQQPAKAETPEQIKERVLNHLAFLQAYYQWALDNQLPYLTTNWYPAAFNMNYTNGVRMAYADELEGWNTCFFDSTQAVEGYKLLSGPMRSVKLKTDVNNYARNIDCLGQLADAIE